MAASRIGGLRISVIIPAREAAPTLGATLHALSEQDLSEPFEVVVALDGDDESTARIARGSGRVDTVVPPTGGGATGPGATRNRGAGASRGSILAFTDADCVPEPRWLSAGLRCMEGADLVQGEVHADPGAARGPYDRTVVVDGESALFETANLMVRRDLFQRLGGFEDWLAMPARSRIGGRPSMGEDVWFGWRAHRAGARIAFCRASRVTHAVFPRSSLEYVAEHGRRVHFPAFAARIPELREAWFFGRWFLDRRTAAFDAAVLGAALAAASRSPWPLVAAVPYGRIAGRRFSPRRPASAKVLLADLAADAVSLAALAVGSARSRALVL